MKLEDIKTGDTFLVRNPKDFISRMICKVMTKWGKKKGYNTDLVYSHAARFGWIANELYLFGSIDSGYRPILFKLHYSLEDNCVIMRRNKDLSNDEQNQTINYCMYLTTVSKLYQYWNFIQWLMLVYLNIDTFKKDSDGFTYCYESERMARANLNPENYKDVYKTDIFQLIYDPNYKIIYKN